MPRTSRAIVQVCVSLLAAMCTLGAASQSAQTSPPPVSTGQQVSTPAARPQPTAPTPEMRAFQEASRIQDRVEKLAALRRVQADLANSVAVMVARQVDEAILWHLVAHFADQRDEIVRAFERVLVSMPASPPESRLVSLSTIVGRLLDNKIVLDRAEKPLMAALAAAKTSPKDQPANPTVFQAAMAELSGRTGAARGRALETLGRLHAAQGQEDLAERDFKEALEVSLGLTRASLALAELEVKRGNKTAALDHYLVAAVGGRMKPGEEAALRALYRDVKGNDASLDADLDRTYDTHFPNPITPKKYEPASPGSRRVALLELFTGSACSPCVSADLALDAVLQRYPETLIAPLAYHAHIPGPDPMVVSGGDARREYYRVRGVPTMNVNGALGRLGGGPRESAVRSYDAYVAAIDKALSTPPAADVQVHAARAGAKIAVTAKASGLPDGASNLRLHIVLAERHLSFSGENGIRHHAMVVRGVAADDHGFGIPIRGSSDTTVDHTFDLSQIGADVEATLADEIARRRKTRGGAVTPPDYRAEGRALSTINPDALVVIAFVQDASKNVLQAARADVK